MMRKNILRVVLALGIAVLQQACKPKELEQQTGATSDKPAVASKVEMVLLKSGAFMMGDEDEVDAQPHQVSVSAFYMDKYLVTQKEYQRVMGKNPARWQGSANPIEQVRWSDAVRYCNKRSELAGLEPCYDLEKWQCDFSKNGFRLPTEAEWEYACRAGTKTAYFFGNDAGQLGKYAWFEDNSGGKPHPVGQKQANPWGIYDICGNVWEWCNDYYQVDYYQQSPSVDPRGPEQGESKVVRGGAWKFSAESCRSAYRYNENPGYTDVCFGYDIYGFRCVRNATGDKPEP
jgi:formylglycine-generating enzyme required for sulfatase activity